MTATDALLEVVDAMGNGRGGAGDVLRARAWGLRRAAEVLQVVVPGSGRTG